MNPGNNVLLTLIPLSSDGKKVLDNAGTNLWRLYRVANKVYFSEDEGIWLFIGPSNKPYPSVLSTWVLYNEGKDFKIIGDIPETFENLF
jgi:hypothetical protein